jgi:hypothetical protein
MSEKQDGGPIWTDATSYSQGERGKVSPRAWECTICGARILVMSGHINYRGTWVLSCHQLSIETKILKPVEDGDLPVVKAMALEFAQQVANRRLSEMGKLVAGLAAAREGGAP